MNIITLVSIPSTFSGLIKTSGRCIFSLKVQIQFKELHV